MTLPRTFTTKNPLKSGYFTEISIEPCLASMSKISRSYFSGKIQSQPPISRWAAAEVSAGVEPTTRPLTRDRFDATERGRFPCEAHRSSTPADFLYGAIPIFRNDQLRFNLYLWRYRQRCALERIQEKMFEHVLGRSHPGRVLVLKNSLSLKTSTLSTCSDFCEFFWDCSIQLSSSVASWADWLED